MSLIIQKFGGSSVADAHHLLNVAKKVTKAYSDGNDVVVVVSAQGDTTDKMLENLKNINKNPSKRELDAYISCGEQMSASLLAMTIQNLGFNAISLTGWQAKIFTDSYYGNAEILNIIPKRIKEELSKKNIVVIAGFQGIDEENNISTLGRGGSDTSAVALAAALNADRCKIYTDVDGVYTADPRIVSSAKKIDEISYDEMFALSKYGAQVLHDKSILTAKKNNVKVEVLSSMLSNSIGTIVKNVENHRANPISGIAVLNHIAKITITDIYDKSIFYNNIFSELKKSGINVDTSFSTVEKKQNNFIIFAVDETKLDETIKILEKYFPEKDNIFYDKNKSIISTVALSDTININIASIIFEILEEIKINVEMIACDDKRVSILISSVKTHSALNAIHSKLFEEDTLL
ncbi:MAG: aspartate kinase [Clostridia bacterium]|nr:aspartate kinase [Clostridia bacterium]